MSVYNKPIIIDLRNLLTPNIQEELNKHHDKIHDKIFNSIKEALAKNADSIAILRILLSDSEICFDAKREFWLDNLKHTLKRYTEMEEYEKCSEVAELIKKLQ